MLDYPGNDYMETPVGVPIEPPRVKVKSLLLEIDKNGFQTITS
jgi:hypothetical protein